MIARIFRGGMKVLRCAICKKIFHSSVYVVYEHIKECHPAVPEPD